MTGAAGPITVTPVMHRNELSAVLPAITPGISERTSARAMEALPSGK